jgi:uncharacterized protein YegJ (DUF2314 family)
LARFSRCLILAVFACRGFSSQEQLLDTLWVSVSVTVLLVLVVAIFLWRRARARRRDETRLVSIVALLSAPRLFDPAIVASVAGKVWSLDLGDGSSPGEDGFVVGNVGPMTAIHAEGRMMIINSFPSPYVPNVDEVAASISDMRRSQLFAEHKAWFSIDAMGVTASSTDDEVREWYRRLGPLFAELLDEQCLLLFLPDADQLFALNEETELALRSADPHGELKATATVPLVHVDGDDPALAAAVAEARAKFPEFVAAFEEKRGENFGVKAPVTRDDATEFIWVEVTAIEGTKVYGQLANEPFRLRGLKLGSKVAVESSELNDWGYIDPQGQFVGGFTVAAVSQAAAKTKPRSEPS